MEQLPKQIELNPTQRTELLNRSPEKNFLEVVKTANFTVHQKCACTRSHLAQIQQKLESPARTVQSKRFLCQSNWISNLFWPLVCRTKVRGASNCLASIKHPSCMHATTTTTVRLLTTTMTDFFYHNNHNNIENDNRRQFALTKCMIVH